MARSSSPFLSLPLSQTQFQALSSHSSTRPKQQKPPPRVSQLVQACGYLHQALPSSHLPCTMNHLPLPINLQVYSACCVLSNSNNHELFSSLSSSRRSRGIRRG
jgi:hypothetical protein